MAASAVIGALRVNLGLDSAQFNKGLKQAQSSLGDVGKRMSAAGRALSTRVTAPIAAFGALSLRAAGNFEMAMNNVAAVSGATEAQLGKLTALAKEMGATTRFSASQAAEAMGFLAMAGFEAEEIMAALPGTLQLAASAQMELGQTADVVSNILTGYGLEVQELGRVNDVLVKAFTSANTNLEQLGEAMKYAGPLASAAGVEFETAAAALALMGNAGIQASMAGTSLRGAISRLLNPTKQVWEAMEEVGLQATDANGKLLPLDQILQQLEPHADDAGLFMKLFGQRAGPAMAALVSQGSQALRDLDEELRASGGTAERISAVQMQGFNGAMRELASAFEALQIAIAESGLLEFMTDLVRKVTAFIQDMAKSNPEILKWGVAIAGIAAAVGPVLFVLGSLVSSIGSLIKIVPLALAAAKGVAAAMALMGGPVTLVIAGLAALLAAWHFYGDGIKAEATRLFTAVDEALGGGLTVAIDAAKVLLDGFVENLRLTLQFIGQILTGDLAGAFQTFLDAFRNVWETAKAFLDAILPGFVETLTGWGAQVVQIVADTVIGIGTWLKDKLGAIFDFVADKVVGTINVFRDMYQAVVGGSYVPDMIDGIEREFARLPDVMVAPAEAAADAVGDAFSKVIDTVSGLLDKLLSDGKLTFDDLKKAALSLAKTLFIQPFFNALKGSFGGGGFAGLFADGGFIPPGQWGIAGEDGPEPVFGGRTGATVVPSDRAGGGGHTVVQNFNVATPNADSFRASERQISRMLKQRFAV